MNDKKIFGYVDKYGFFINKQNTEEKNLKNLSIQVLGWKRKFRKILSSIFIAQENYEFEITKITFSPNGFLTVEEKDSFTIKKLELVELMALTSGEAPLTNESQGKCRLRLVGDGKEMDVPFSDAEQARAWMDQLMEKARCDL